GVTSGLGDGLAVAVGAAPWSAAPPLPAAPPPPMPAAAPTASALPPAIASRAPVHRTTRSLGVSSHPVRTDHRTLDSGTTSLLGGAADGVRRRARHTPARE